MGRKSQRRAGPALDTIGPPSPRLTSDAVEPVLAPSDPSAVAAAAAALVDPVTYDSADAYHAAAAVLRRHQPVARAQHPDYPAVWLVTRHADVFDISKDAQVWRNRPEPILLPTAFVEEQEARGLKMETLIHLDDPRHRELRALTVDWFKPSSLARLQDRIDELARRSVDRLRELGGECDFAREIALSFPLQTILSMLGLPESDYGRMFQLTQEIFAGADPELRRDDEDWMAVLVDFFQYFSELTEARKAHPTDDLASLIANATVGGEPLGVMEQLSYYVIVASAGHDTTSSSMAGGMLALAQHPSELARLRDDPDLIPTAVEEIIRWVSPVKHFLRNAVEPIDVGGHHFEPGDVAMLQYWSANFDEAVFDEPHRFDVGRTPNRHLAFGFGAHFCLGAMLARMQIKSLLAHLVPVLDEVQVAGPTPRTQSTFVSGLKHLPLRYTLRP